MQAKSWKTTTLGILAIASAVISAANALLQGHPVDMQAVMTAVLSGIGLIAAADHSVVVK